MTGSPNRYLIEPRLFELPSTIASVEPLPHGGWSIACRETIFRPSGGGQPEDYGTIEIEGVEHEVRGVHKANGLTYLLLDLQPAPQVSAPVIQRIDGQRRNRLSHLHTLQHMFSAEAARLLPEANPCGTGIRNDANSGWVRLRFAGLVEDHRLIDIDRAVRSDVLAGAHVFIARAKSVEEAEMRYGAIFRLDPSVKLSGKVRVVVIEGIDANCCSGTHWDSSDVGPYGMTITRQSHGNEVRLDFTLAGAWPYFYGDRLPMAPTERAPA